MAFGSYFPKHVLNLGHQQWKHGVFTTEPPGNSPFSIFSSSLLSILLNIFNKNTFGLVVSPNCNFVLCLDFALITAFFLLLHLVLISPKFTFFIFNFLWRKLGFLLCFILFHLLSKHIRQSILHKTDIWFYIYFVILIKFLNIHSYSCLENPDGQRSLAGYSPWGHEESDTTEQLSTAPTFQVPSCQLL